MPPPGSRIGAGPPRPVTKRPRVAVKRPAAARERTDEVSGEGTGDESPAVGTGGRAFVEMMIDAHESIVVGDEQPVDEMPYGALADMPVDEGEAVRVGEGPVHEIRGCALVGIENWFNLWGGILPLPRPSGLGVGCHPQRHCKTAWGIQHPNPVGFARSTPEAEPI
jgi:hypothetical protein